MQHFTTLDDAELIRAVQSGAVGILPTDTVYGVVAKMPVTKQRSLDYMG
jgi:tRNA A37 threonylcarbamoyladenosine synthetase subunit TsaC/SUA5/YrdC